MISLLYILTLLLLLFSFVQSYKTDGAKAFNLSDAFLLSQITIVYLTSWAWFFGFHRLQLLTFILFYVSSIFTYICFKLVEIQVGNKELGLERKDQCNITNFDRIVATLLFFYLIFNVFSKLSSSSWLLIFSEEIKEGFTNAYIVYFLIFYCCYFLYYASNKLDYLFCVSLLFIVFLLGVKGVVLIPLFALVIKSFVWNKKINIKNSFLFMLLLMCIFFLAYVIPKWILEEGDFRESFYSASQKFIVYLSAGILSLNSNLSLPLPENTYQNIPALFTPVYNALGSIFDYEKTNYMVNVVTPIADTGYVKGSNVKTFVGTIYLHSGWFSLLIVVFFNILLTFFYWLILKRIEKLKYTCAALVLFLSAIFFSWFEYYYWHAFFYYAIVYGVILDAIRYGINSVKTKRG